MDEQRRQLDRLAHVPMLVVWGKADRLVKPAHLERWKQLFAQVQVLALDDVGHFPQLEAPDELHAALERRVER